VADINTAAFTAETRAQLQKVAAANGVIINVIGTELINNPDGTLSLMQFIEVAGSGADALRPDVESTVIKAISAILSSLQTKTNLLDACVTKLDFDLQAGAAEMTVTAPVLLPPDSLPSDNSPARG
jgi:hypothetical protein